MFLKPVLQSGEVSVFHFLGLRYRATAVLVGSSARRWWFAAAIMHPTPAPTVLLSSAAVAGGSQGDVVISVWV